jgi:hypothetical protein
MEIGQQHGAKYATWACEPFLVYFEGFVHGHMCECNSNRPWSIKI